ncbi:MAG: hypothetical protein JWO69_1250 [Thermoleophilia bacterium]|jgi:hypothetical protein|nr:hypothetical protein [Thermoleophilia bacterium]
MTDETPDKPRTDPMDPDALKEAHGRTGRLLKSAGLPFEEDEFDDDSSSSSSSSSSSEGDAPAPPA